jgi:hypothetical protein
MTGPTPPRNKSGSRAQRPARRLDSLDVMPLLMVLIHTGCDFPIPSSKYEVGWGGTKGAEASAGSVALFEEPASPEVFRIVSAFAGGDTTCGQSFVEECAEVLNACANAPRCVEFSECVRGRALPTAETTCADELGASTEETWAFERTRHCWATRYAQCEIGKDFSCAYAYNAPGSKSSSITISQQLLLLNEEQAESDFTVTFCDALSDCSPELAMTSRLTCPRRTRESATAGSATGGSRDPRSTRVSSRPTCLSGAIGLKLPGYSVLRRLTTFPRLTAETRAMPSSCKSWTASLIQLRV